MIPAVSALDHVRLSILPIDGAMKHSLLPVLLVVMIQLRELVEVLMKTKMTERVALPKAELWPRAIP